MDRCGVMTSKHMDAFFTFLTTRAPHGVPDEYAQQYGALAENELVPVSFMLGLAKISPKCLQRIQEFLDRVFAAPARRYAIDRFGMNYAVLKAQQLEGVEVFLKRNLQVYQSPNLRLMNVGQSVLSTGEAEVEVLRRVIDTVVKTGLNSSGTSASNGSSCPQTLDFVRTSLRLQYVMVLFSALRYGCTFETLGLTEIFNKIDKAEREQCWRWLAFVIFYPRLKKLAANHKLRCVDLSRNLLDPDDAGTFIKTLVSPGHELVRCDSRSLDRVLPRRGTLTTCVVMQGAKFYAETKVETEIILELDQQAHLEVLCTQKDWVCVVCACTLTRTIKSSCCHRRCP